MRELTQHDIGSLDVERAVARPGSALCKRGDTLAIALCTYFSFHMDRPEEDEDTEDDSNYYWGDWVIEKTDESLRLIAEQINKLQKEVCDA